MGLELPGAAWSDPLDDPVAAFSRYAVRLDLASVSASHVSAPALGLVTNFMATTASGAWPVSTSFSMRNRGSAASFRSPCRRRCP
jgi:hypothetical protein